jgi:MFS superfamily sulfate permease-like transporter
MKYKKEKKIITFMVWLSILTVFIDVSYGIYFAVMTNVVTNYLGHYTRRYIDG